MFRLVNLTYYKINLFLICQFQLLYSCSYKSILSKYFFIININSFVIKLLVSFREFYRDIKSEFEKCGRIIQIKVCCNKSLHLRGNVYIQYKKENDATKAFQTFNGRWYAGKQLSCMFISIDNWKPAVCGKFIFQYLKFICFLLFII